MTHFSAAPGRRARLTATFYALLALPGLARLAVLLAIGLKRRLPHGLALVWLLTAGAAQAQTPSFAAQAAFATDFGPQSVAAADVNGDGKPDLLVANTNRNTVSVLLNTFLCAGCPFSR